jgi:hypothetical protein
MHVVTLTKNENDFKDFVFIQLTLNTVLSMLFVNSQHTSSTKKEAYATSEVKYQEPINKKISHVRCKQHPTILEKKLMFFNYFYFIHAR